MSNETTSTPEPIIGQEAITPDGLGRVCPPDKLSEDGEVLVRFHVATSRGMEVGNYRLSEVELIDPRGPQNGRSIPLTTAKIPNGPTTAHGEGLRIALAQVRDEVTRRQEETPCCACRVFPELLEWLDDLAEDGS